MTWDSIIDDLGGTFDVARELTKLKSRADASTVSCWRDRGIPPRRWAVISLLAANKGCSHITLEVLAAAKRARARA